MPWWHVGEWRYSSKLLTSPLDGGEWSASCPSHFTLMERAPCTHWTGGWVGPKLIWMLWCREKPLGPARNQTLASQPVACRYTMWAIPASHGKVEASINSDGADVLIITISLPHESQCENNKERLSHTFTSTACGCPDDPCHIKINIQRVLQFLTPNIVAVHADQV
jgi:hypothetical protein